MLPPSANSLSELGENINVSASRGCGIAENQTPRRGETGCWFTPPFVKGGAGPGLLHGLVDLVRLELTPSDVKPDVATLTTIGPCGPENVTK